MRFAISALLVFVTCVVVASSRNPAGVYYGYYPYQYTPSYELNAEAIQHPRQLIWSISDIITVGFPRPTVRVTETITSTMTCTKSVARNCRLYQRPFKQRSSPLNSAANKETFEEENDEDEQFPISPSVVQGVETTQVPSREARAAEPQYFVNSPAYKNYPYDIQSAFNSGPYNPVVMPFYGSYPVPAAVQRQLFSGILTVTATVSTVLEMATITKVPRCSRAGPIVQCPINP